MSDNAESDQFSRVMRHAVENNRGVALDSALSEIGWDDALHVDKRLAVSDLFAAQGRVDTSSSALARLVAFELGVVAEPGVALVLPAIGDWNPPGQIESETIAVRGLCVGCVNDEPTTLVIPVEAKGGPAALIWVASNDLELRHVRGVDPEAGVLEVSGSTRRNSSSWTLTEGDWSRAISVGRIGIGYEILGATRMMLELARSHALDRVQFGKPIARYQAVRHLLAEALVAIDAAEAVLDAVWDTQTPFLVATAKAIVGGCGHTVSRHCQQVLAGIGFTEEHSFHRYLRRVLLLDQLLGSSARLTSDIGTILVSSRRVPEFIPL